MNINGLHDRPNRTERLNRIDYASIVFALGVVVALCLWGGW